MNPGPVPDLTFEPALLEAAVLLAISGHRLEPRYRRERNRCYETASTGGRESAFRALDRRFFDELELAKPLADAVATAGSPLARVERVAVVRAPSPRDEGADLFGSSGEGAVAASRLAVGVAVQPETLAAPDRFRSLLRRELVYVADLLDPAFGFAPALAAGALNGARANLVRERYRALWRVSVEGRLAGTGRAREASEAEARRALAAVLARPAEGFESLFQRLWTGSRPTHSELVALADRGGATASVSGPAPGAACPLCEFPSHGFEPAPERLPQHIQAAITGDFPAWTPAQGLCIQCADLYRALPLATKERTA